MRSLALLVIAAGCGRLGFSPIGANGDDVLGDGGVAGNEIGLRVVSDGDGDVSPIQNAVVLIDRGNGVLERLATSESGTAVFAATGPTRFVVVYPDTANSWRVFDIDAVPPGTLIHFGARGSSAYDHVMTMTLPSVSGPNIGYTVSIPSYCGYSPNTGGTAVGALYVTRCEGKSVHVVAQAGDSMTQREFDAGFITLANHGATTLSGAYAIEQPYTVNVSNLPASTFGGNVIAGLDILDPDLAVIGVGGYGSATIGGANATLTPHGTTLGNAVAASISTYNGGAYQLSTGVVARRGIATTMAVDARTMLPMINQLSLPPSANSAAWTLDVPTSVAPQLFAYEADLDLGGGRTVRWTAYTGAGKTHVAFPQLPADLAAADPTGGTWVDAVVIAVAYPGASYGALIPTVDRDWRDWYMRGAVPSDNFTLAQIDYDIGLGSP